MGILIKGQETSGCSERESGDGSRDKEKTAGKGGLFKERKGSLVGREGVYSISLQSYFLQNIILISLLG